MVQSALHTMKLELCNKNDCDKLLHKELFDQGIDYRAYLSSCLAGQIRDRLKQKVRERLYYDTIARWESKDILRRYFPGELQT